MVASFLQGQSSKEVEMELDGFCRISQERNSSQITQVYRNNARCEVHLLRCDAVLSAGIEQNFLTMYCHLLQIEKQVAREKSR
jgi:hypothetical protein